MINIEKLEYHYPHTSKPALNSVDLHVDKGEFILVTGKSGCGKSTLACTLNGIIPHISGGDMEGKVVVNGKNTKNFTVFQMAQEVGFIFQNPESQFFNLQVEDEVAFGPENLGLDPEEIDKRVSKALHDVKMTFWRKHNVFNLSEGQKQRVTIAANLSLNPELLVLDEPTSNLDLPGAIKLFQTLERLKNNGKTIVLIDHRTQHVRELVDRVIIMDEGKIPYEGGKKLLHDPEAMKKYSIRNPTHLTTMVKKFNAYNTSNISHNTSKVILEVNNLSYQYSNGFALEDVSFTLKKGEILGIVGNNGSGKTTLAKVLAGLLKPGKGTIIFFPEDQGGNKISMAHKLGMVLQNPDHQLFMNKVHTELSFGLSELGFSLEEIESRVEDILSSMNLSKLRNRHPHSLSSGEKQRTLISAFMTRQPHLLILDEPTTGMDSYHMNQLVGEIMKLQGDGVSFILISHDIEFLLKTTHKLIFMENGKIIDEKLTEECYNLYGDFKGLESFQSLVNG